MGNLQFNFDNVKTQFPIIHKPFDFNIYLLTSWDRSIIDLVSNTKGVWCAGGSPLALYIKKINQVNDWDLFIENESIKTIVNKKLSDLGFKKINTIGYLDEWAKGEGFNACNVQVISKHSSDQSYDKDGFIRIVFDNFDISVCRVGFYDLDCFYLREDAYSDIKKREFNLLIISSKTKERIEKYKQKGFTFKESSLDTAITGEALY